jgi:hypothetical protein
MGGGVVFLFQSSTVLQRDEYNNPSSPLTLKSTITIALLTPSTSVTPPICCSNVSLLIPVALLRPCHGQTQAIHTTQAVSDETKPTASQSSY